MTEFLFLRPWLLWLLIPALLVMLWLYKRTKQQVSHQLIAPHLAANIVVQQGKTERLWLPVGLLLLLGVFASAGPSWQKKQIPVYQNKAARVLVMDMSRSMYSTDIKPSRLAQARYKALDMVKLFVEGETALIAYAGEAFTISPLTSDSKTLENLIPSLSPDIMPVAGSNVLSGLELAAELLKQAGYPQGDIILLSDGIDSQELGDVNQFIAKQPYQLNIYAIGTAQGAPISLPQGGFLKDNSGQIVIPKTYFTPLAKLAKNSGGVFARYQPSNSNLSQFVSQKSNKKSEKEQQKTLWRIDGGTWLLFVIIPLALWLMQRKALVLCAALVLLQPLPNAYAQSTQSWFKNAEQNALSAYKNKDYQHAAQSKNPAIKGAALYQQGDYQGALTQFNQDSSARGLYNQGNALTQLGEYDKAIEKYQQAAKADPTLRQAQKNQQIAEQLKQQKEQEQKQQGQQEQEQEKQNQQSEGQKNQDQQNQQQGSQQNGQNGEQNKPSQQGEDQKSQENQPSDAQNDPQSDSASSGQTNQPQPQVESQPQQNDNQGESKQTVQQQADPKGQDERQGAVQGEKDAKTPPQGAISDVQPLTPEQREKAQQIKQLLRKVPDDPAILLRNKMQIKARQQRRQRYPQGVEKSW